MVITTAITMRPLTPPTLTLVVSSVSWCALFYGGVAGLFGNRARLSQAQHERISRHRSEARQRFRGDPGVVAAVTRLDSVL